MLFMEEEAEGWEELEVAIQVVLPFLVDRVAEVVEDAARLLLISMALREEQ